MGLPATGRPMTMAGIMIYRVIDGLIVEDHEAVDEAGLLRQLGAPVSDARRTTPLIQPD
jgi:predicted ester cyclase